jgi:tetratricopeptide (TPR) repeat protein
MNKMKNLILIVAYFVFFALSLAEINVYDEFQNAKKFYSEKEYVKAAYSLELVLNEVPDYKEAKVLYFKVKLEQDEPEALGEILTSLLTTDDKVRGELFNYLMLRNEEYALESVYRSLEDKAPYRDIFLEYLYLNKRYLKILYKYPEIEYVKKVEANKQKADEYFYQALSLLKQNKTNEAMALMKKSVETYPENYIYYFKIGQVYADNKNFQLAEHNFYEALSYEDSEEVKVSLLNLYYDQKNYDMVYETSKSIAHLPEVRKKLKSIYYEQEDEFTRVKVITRWNQQITIDRRQLGYISLGDTFILSSVLPSVFDNRTGERLATRSIPVARVRVSRIDQKLTTLEIIEEYIIVEVEQEYIIN